MPGFDNYVRNFGDPSLTSEANVKRRYRQGLLNLHPNKIAQRTGVAATAEETARFQAFMAAHEKLAGFSKNKDFPELMASYRKRLNAPNTGPKRNKQSSPASTMQVLLDLARVNRYLQDLRTRSLFAGPDPFNNLMSSLEKNGITFVDIAASKRPWFSREGFAKDYEWIQGRPLAKNQDLVGFALKDDKSQQYLYLRAWFVAGHRNMWVLDDRMTTLT